MFTSRHEKQNSYQQDAAAQAVMATDFKELGFTIVELMIATVVFSMVLLVIVFGVLSFTHAYYSGINSSTTQDTARNIINDVAESVQFSGSPITPTPNPLPAAGSQVYFCAGNSVYVYKLGVMYTGSPSLSNPGLYVVPGSCVVPASIPTTNGKELLTSNMRVTVLIVIGDATNRLYTVTLGVAYGDSDLLCNASKDGSAGGCYPNDSENTTGLNIVTPLGSINDVQCREDSGSQFCAHAALSTTVSLRVASSALN